MFQLKIKFGLLNKLFNLQSNEWPKVTLAWLMQFFYRVSFVILWTVIVGIFVSYFGISSLPYLFVLNGAFIIMGTFFYSSFLESFKEKSIILATVIVCAVLLILALVIGRNDQILLFSLLLGVEAILLGQLRILLLGFIEEMFTPTQSERTFPIIGGAETIGGIIGGLAMMFLIGNSGTTLLILLSVFLTLLIIPCVLASESLINKVKLLKNRRRKKASVGFFDKINKAFLQKKHSSFMKGLLLIVFLYWLLFNLMEFQYTKAIYNNVNDVVLSGGAGFKNAFIYDLGFVFVVFSSCALLLQLFLASRLINYLGVIGSMLLHPILFLLSIISVFLSFSYATAVLMKTNYTVTSVLHKDAYHSSYYAIKRNLRVYMHEIGEGLIRPLGAVFGTLILILIHSLFSDSTLVHAVSFSMFVVTILLLIVTYKQQSKYTDAAIYELKHGKDKTAKINAIDILAQRGHKDSFPLLRKMLADPSEPLSIRLRVLKAFKRLQDPGNIDAILDCLKSRSAGLRIGVLETLKTYRIFGANKKKYLFLEGKIVNTLKEFFKKEKLHSLRSRVIDLLSHFSPVIAYDFLNSILRSSKGTLKADAIYALGSFKDESLMAEVIPYLKSKNPLYKINAAIALGRFKTYQKEVFKIVSDFSNSRYQEQKLLGVYAIGELKLKKLAKTCAKFLKSKRHKVRIESALALLKMDNKLAVPTILDYLLGNDVALSKYVQKELAKIPGRLSKQIDKLVKSQVSERIEHLVFNIDFLEDLDIQKLLALKRFYLLAEQYSEVEDINHILGEGNT